MSQETRESHGAQVGQYRVVLFLVLSDLNVDTMRRIFSSSPLMLCNGWVECGWVECARVVVMFPAQQQQGRRGRWGGVNGRMLSVPQLSSCCFENGHRLLPQPPFHVLFVLTRRSNWKQLQERVSYVRVKGGRSVKMGRENLIEMKAALYRSYNMVIQFFQSFFYSVYKETSPLPACPSPFLPCSLNLFAIVYWPWTRPTLYQSFRSIWNGQDNGSQTAKVALWSQGSGCGAPNVPEGGPSECDEGNSGAVIRTPKVQHPAGKAWKHCSSGDGNAAGDDIEAVLDHIDWIHQPGHTPQDHGRKGGDGYVSGYGSRHQGSLGGRRYPGMLPCRNQYQPPGLCTIVSFPCFLFSFWNRWGDFFIFFLHLSLTTAIWLNW